MTASGPSAPMPGRSGAAVGSVSPTAAHRMER